MGSEQPVMSKVEAAWILVEMRHSKLDELKTLLPKKRKALQRVKLHSNLDESKALPPKKRKALQRVQLHSKLDESKTLPPKKRKASQSVKSKCRNVKRPRKQKRKEVNLEASAPEMPIAMRERIAEMGGYEIELVAQKQLYDTDLTKNHGRLSLPIKKLKFDFVTEEEAILLNETDGKSKKGMNVMIVDPGLRERKMCLKRWKIGKDNVYCLMTHWNSLVQQNNLKSDEVVQLWSFRKDGVDIANETPNLHHLCFAITTPNIDEFQ